MNVQHMTDKELRTTRKRAELFADWQTARLVTIEMAKRREPSKKVKAA